MKFIVSRKYYYFKNKKFRYVIDSSFVRYYSFKMIFCPIMISIYEKCIENIVCKWF